MHGPQFLIESADCWPRMQVSTFRPFNEDPEIKKIHPICLNSGGDIVDNFICSHSSWFKLRQRVALLLRVRLWLQQKCAQRECPNICSSVSADEMEAARIALIHHVQRKGFPDYFSGSLPVRGPLSPLKPQFNEDKLLVVGDHVANGDFPEEIKHSAIFPRRNHMVDFIIRDIHECGHVGKEQVLATLNEQYWVINGRRAVRRVLTRCVTCRRWEAKPIVQQIGELPKSSRCQVPSLPPPPFVVLGFTFLALLWSKEAGASVQKRYGCLLTCMPVRAVHIEVCFTLDTDSFIHALYRFMSRQGCPKHIFCDNGINFVGAEGQLKELLGFLDQKRIQKTMLHKGIEWHFNPPSASHMGGAWERLIRSIRKVLCPMIFEQTLEDEGLTTFMCIVVTHQ